MADASNNRLTLQAYEDNLQAYIEGTPQTVHGPFQKWLDQVLGHIARGGTILELGTAFGRDADYIEAHGFRVVRTDAVTGFVDLLAAQAQAAHRLDALADDFGGPYDAVYANAVVLHFTPQQLAEVLRKAHTALASDGILAFTVKQGSGAGWNTDKLGAKRYFHYWTADPLAELVKSANFEIIQLESGSYPHRPDTIWLRVIARKSNPGAKIPETDTKAFTTH
ncbi:MAG TPA: methyltransferase domain-containing protein [Candidatus Saccharimonadia bacterium]|nr:methyltransferase domain-containing protein [Candidatus Saccharimonadia bacterium]